MPVGRDAGFRRSGRAKQTGEAGGRACRRAERALFRLRESGTEAPPAPESLAFLNRLSDLLWLYGRVLERESGVDGALRRSKEDPPGETEPG